MKVALVANIVAPYRKPLFEELGQHCDLTVICSAANESDREWQDWHGKETELFKTIVLSGLSFKTKQGFFYLQTGLLSALRQVRPDVVINSSFNLNTLWGSLYAKMVRKPSLIWSEATSFSERNRSFARLLFRKLLVRLNDAYVPSGIEAKAFLLSLGAAEARCFTAVDAIADVSRHWEIGVLRREVQEIRSRYAGCVLLYSGQLIERKGLDLLFKAYQRMPKAAQITLLILGSGPLDKELKEMAARMNLKSVEFLGFKQTRELWPYYLAADVYVLPTREDVWGLVVNEAMLCGLPVVCSQYAGCCSDLVINGKTGFIVDPYDTQGLSKYLCEIISNTELRKSMSEAALEKIAEYSMEASAQGFLSAISFCQSRGRN